MQLNYVYRQYEDFYVGHFIDFPEYDTQGRTIEELEGMLKSLYADLTSFESIQLSTPYQQVVLELV
jgi:predicted RNase H-like HicB family nuclease